MTLQQILWLQKNSNFICVIFDDVYIVRQSNDSRTMIYDFTMIG